MELLRCETLPEGHGYYESAAFGESEAQQIEDAGADLAAYWYGSGSYEGAGNILARKNGRWYHHECGHCSCYGPTCQIDFSGAGDDSIEALLDRCSADLRKELEPLAALLLKHITPPALP